MRRKTLGRAGALAALTAALCLAQGGVLAAEASAQTYDLAEGSVTVKAEEGVQYVTQAGGVSDEPQTSDTVIGQTGSASASTTNTITVVSESGQTAKVTLSGVNVDVSNDASAAMSTSGAGDVTVTLLGQNSLKSGHEHAGLEKNSTGNLTITANNTDQGLTATGGGHGAGIGGGRYGSASSITISGGTINASGTNMDYSGGAGIGGGQNGNGTDITITGGKVTATGAYGAAGIGGDNDGSGSGITISGGKVVATGGDEGAGIGGGHHGDGSRITITGGEVTAAGGDEGAGIGGGARGNGTYITIAGGKVTATGAYYGAGIGGGLGTGEKEGNAADITITGGEVVATGGYKAAGIGGAYRYGTCRDVRISGGKVTATGGEDAPGIGGMGYTWCDEPVTRPSCSGVTIAGGDVTCVGGAGAAGIGGGRGQEWDQKTICDDVTVSGSARLRVRGGTMDSVTPHRAAGASIGGGAWDVWNTQASYYDGEETEPDVCALATDGWIEYYAAGEEMTEENLTKTVVGTGDHAWDDGTVTVKPTCTEPGERTYTCTRNPEHPKRTEAVPATGHDWEEVTYTWSKDRSTCTATRACRTDADHVEAETVDAVATVTQPLTCTDDELTAYTATFENEAFEAQTLEDVKTASATGHDFTAEKAEDEYLASAATCTERAVYYTSCSACGLSSKGTEAEETFEYGEPDPASHGHLDHVAAKAATTKSAGNVEYWYCSACKRYFSDAAGTKEISKADTVIAKKKALPATGDGTTTQTAALLTAGIAGIGAALVIRRRAV